MYTKVGLSVCGVTLTYQLIDAGAIVALSGYSRGGVATILLFWALPMTVAFALSYWVTASRDHTHDRALYGAVLSGAAIGQALGLATLLPTDVIPALTVGGVAIETSFTALLVFVVSGGGVGLARARAGDPPVGRRFALLAGILFLLSGVLSAVGPYRSVSDQILQFAIAGWLFVVARYG